jgi:hypothetical protein
VTDDEGDGGGQGGGQDPLDKILFLEYLGRGSLHKVLCRIRELGHPIPNRVLWLLFQCCKFPFVHMRTACGPR